VRTAARQVGAAIRALEHRLGRSPEDSEVAAALGVSVEQYRDELEGLTRVAFVELGSDTDLGPAARHGGPSPSDAVERSQLVARVRACLGQLPERDALVLSLYYVEEFNYAEIGQVLDVSESRVCQLHARALARMRALFDEEE
jgi:RNA polymerase sigma factor for flagellar operon FliA